MADKFATNFPGAQPGYPQGIVNLAQYTLRISYDGSSNIEYVGIAQAGANTASAVWQIRKFTYSTGLLTTITYADGDPACDNIWDNRASLSYS